MYCLEKNHQDEISREATLLISILSKILLPMNQSDLVIRLRRKMKYTERAFPSVMNLFILSSSLTLHQQISSITYNLEAILLKFL